MGSEHTQEIMSRVQYRTFLESAHPRCKAAGVLGVGPKTPQGHQMQQLRLALAKNLGRAIVCGR